MDRRHARVRGVGWSRGPDEQHDDWTSRHDQWTSGDDYRLPAESRRSRHVWLLGVGSEGITNRIRSDEWHDEQRAESNHDDAAKLDYGPSAEHDRFVGDQP